MCKQGSISRILCQHASISRFFVNENMVSFLGFWYVNILLFLDTKGFRGRRQSGGVGRPGWSVQTVWTVWTARTPPSLLLADAPWDIRWEADFDLRLQLGTYSIIVVSWAILATVYYVIYDYCQSSINYVEKMWITLFSSSFSCLPLAWCRVQTWLLIQTVSSKITLDLVHLVSCYI